jgi:hypothetical protein
MRFTRFALAAAAAHNVLAAPSLRPTVDRAFSCGAPEPDAEHIQISQKFAAQEAAALREGRFSALATTTVDVYFHVVSNTTALKDGYLTVQSHPHPPKR